MPALDVAIGVGRLGNSCGQFLGKLKKASAIYTHQCSGEGREKREGKSLCGGNHITSLLYLREERKKVLTHSCKGILHLHRYDLILSVFNAYQRGMCRFLIWTLGPELRGHPHPHGGPQHQQCQGLIIEHTSLNKFIFEVL